MSGHLAKGFLADIVANIDDDTPRLVYADWLDERGEEARAEFIRLQCRMAGRAFSDPRYPGCRAIPNAVLAWRPRWRHLSLTSVTINRSLRHPLGGGT
jgi:uncharacterized protein (TIGR02996 family)